MSRPPSAIRAALALLSVRLVLQQIGLALVVFALSFAWLRIPDASALDVAASALLALLVLAIAGAGESTLILHLADHPRTLARLLRGTLLLLAAAVLWFGWSTLLGHLRGDYNQNDNTLAGYLNSRFPQALRYFFTYDHILRWIGWAWNLLGWIVAGVIAAFVFAWTASLRPMRAVAMLLRSVGYWCVVVLVSVGTTLLTTSLMQWTPGHGLRVEMLSLLLRLGVTVVADAAALCLLLATLAACVRRADVNAAPYNASAGTPDESQPRTADNP
jgi:hypothetical protein